MWEQAILSALAGQVDLGPFGIELADFEPSNFIQAAASEQQQARDLRVGVAHRRIVESAPEQPYLAVVQHASAGRRRGAGR